MRHITIPENLISSVSAVLSTHNLLFTEFSQAASPNYIKSIFRSFYLNDFDIARGSIDGVNGVQEFETYDELFTILSGYSPPANSKGL